LLAWKPPVFVVQTHLGAQQLNCIFAIRPVHNGEGGGEIDPTAELPQHQVGERMKGSARDLVAAAIDKQTGAPQHLLRGPAGECQQQDRTGIDADIDEMGNAIDQRAGLAGAGAGDNQQRSLDRRGRLVLSGVELFAIIEA